MTRGESTQTKIHYKGSNDDFLIFVDDTEQYEKWLKGDTSIPLAQFISSFKIFLTHKYVYAHNKFEVTENSHTSPLLNWGN